MADFSGTRLRISGDYSGVRAVRGDKHNLATPGELVLNCWEALEILLGKYPVAPRDRQIAVTIAVGDVFVDGPFRCVIPEGR
jgi:hypothetical protein